MTRVCGVDGCNKKHYGRGMCLMHYSRNRVGKIVVVSQDTRATALDRFLANIAIHQDGCWLWTAKCNPITGYAYFGTNNEKILGHRWSYEHYVGPVPDGLELDHLCRVRNCVRPDHLEAVTHQENMRRGVFSPWQKRKTHCKWGHPYDEVNTYHYTTVRNGRTHTCRGCRICRRLVQRKKAA